MEVKNPALTHVREVKHIHIKAMDELKEVAAMLATGKWIVIAASEGKDCYLFSMGRVV